MHLHICNSELQQESAYFHGSQLNYKSLTVNWATLQWGETTICVPNYPPVLLFYV